MSNKQKTAIVIGATGLVGAHLVNLLLDDDNYSKINIFVRRTTGISHPKLNEFIVDFDKRDEWRDKVKGDVLFSALGTTLKQAGSKERQYEIDYDYQYNTAVTAATNGVKDYVLVSANNAKKDSSFFYSRMKAELENAVSKLPFTNIIIIQPGLLYGKRDMERKGESFAIGFVNLLNKLGMMKKQRPIHGKEVAQAMLQAYNVADGSIVYHRGEELFSLAAKYKVPPIVH